MFFGKNDSMLKGEFQPDKSDYLKKAFDKEGVAIYKFTTTSTSGVE